MCGRLFQTGPPERVRAWFRTTNSAPEDYPTWLGEAPAEPEALIALLRPYPAERMRAWPVSTRVNGVRNTTADLLDPVEAGRLATANPA